MSSLLFYCFFGCDGLFVCLFVCLFVVCLSVGWFFLACLLACLLFCFFALSAFVSLFSAGGLLIGWLAGLFGVCEAPRVTGNRSFNL